MMKTRYGDDVAEQAATAGLLGALSGLAMVNVRCLGPAGATPVLLMGDLILGFIALCLVSRLDANVSIRTLGAAVILLLALLPASKARFATLDNAPVSDVSAIPAQASRQATLLELPVERVNSGENQKHAANLQGDKQTPELPTGIRGSWSPLGDGRFRFSWRIASADASIWCGVMYLPDDSAASHQFVSDWVNKAASRQRTANKQCRL